jgi:hypothetical protein
MDSSTMRVPDGIEPISAYRAWFYSINGGMAQLYPLAVPPNASARSAWIGAGRNWVTAPVRCSVRPTHEPSEVCSCGFYSLKELDLAVEYAGMCHPMTTQRQERGRVVLGRILLSAR